MAARNADSVSSFIFFGEQFVNESESVITDPIFNSKSSKIFVFSVNSGRLFLVLRLEDLTGSVRISSHKGERWLVGRWVAKYGDAWLSWREIDGY
jgi:hypothetical protein